MSCAMRSCGRICPGWKGSRKMRVCFNSARRILRKIFPLPTKHNDSKRMKTKMHSDKEMAACQADAVRVTQPLTLVLLVLVIALAAGCGGGKPTKQSTDFFTSGSREADQRASQRMAQSEQLSGTGEGAGEKHVKKAVAPPGTNDAPAGVTNQAAQAQGKLALYDRLGAEAGISNIVADFTPRVLQDPRVNWDRKGVKQGGFSI